jgi:hypothetical protein
VVDVGRWFGDSVGVDRSRQNARIIALESVTQVEHREIFPRGWEGLTAAMRNEKAILKYRVQALTYELEKRGHTVEISDAGVFVDRPVSQ